MPAGVVRVALLVPAAALIAFGLAAGPAWFLRHIALPALHPAPPWWTLPALRGTAVLLGLGLAAGAAACRRRVSAGAAARVALAVALAAGASELALRVLHRALPVVHMQVEARLGAPDPRTGWSFVPRRAVELPAPGGRVVRYSIDAHGDRAASPDWIEDSAAPTVVLTGESIAAGHGLDWSETIPARLSERLGIQVVDVAEGGYGSGQAHLRAVDALARLARPLALVTTVLPVQLHRNLRDDRPHLVLRDGALVLAPAAPPGLRLRQLLVNELPYLSEGRLQASLTLTRAILHASAAAARARGAQALFVFPSIGPPRPLDAHPEAFVVRAVVDDLPYVIVDVDSAHMPPWDGHPDAEGARQIAAAVAQALAAP